MQKAKFKMEFKQMERFVLYMSCVAGASPVFLKKEGQFISFIQFILFIIRTA